MSDIVKAAAIVIRNKKLLMVRKYSQTFVAMLGGTIEEGEELLECLKREIPEEVAVHNFEILDSEPFYIAYSKAADSNRSLEIHCYRVELTEEPNPTYNPSKLTEGFDISDIVWVGKDDFDITEVGGKMKCILKPNFKGADGVTLTSTPITEEFIFPEFIKRGLL